MMIFSKRMKVFSSSSFERFARFANLRPYTSALFLFTFFGYATFTHGGFIEDHLSYNNFGSSFLSF
jgi:hypothetical protein